MGLAWLTAQPGSAQFWNRLPGGNLINNNEWLGADVGSTIPLSIETRVNQPIQWRTNNVLRMRLLPTITTGSINGYTGLNLSGHLGLGAFTSGLVAQPFSLLHLDAGGSQDSGFRPWMQSGMTITRQTDQSYFGLKDEGGASNHTVIAWSDNTLVHPGPDRLKFIFVADNTAANGVAGQLNGLEAARFTPDSIGNQTFFGVGDWLTAGLDPTERVDLLNGRLRIRQLPDDAPADSNYVLMVVDTTAAPSGERGVVKWVPASAIANATDCEWTLNAGPFNNVSTAFGPISANCPDAVDAVGMGVDLGSGVAPARLNVRNTNGNANMSAGARVDVTKSGLANGLVVNTTGQSAFGMEVASTASGAGTLAFGARFNVTGGGGQSTRGVQALTHGTCNVAIAGDFHAYDVAGTSIGTQGVSYNGTNYSIGTWGGALGTATRNIGVTGIVGDQDSVPFPSGQRTGVYGLARADDGATVCYGVFGYTMGPDLYTSGGGANSHTKWAGYFPGYTYTTGGVWSSSDEQFKQNIEELPADAAMDKLMQLSPKTYDFNLEAFSYMNLPSEHQYGLIAQEVEAVVPELVTTIHQPAMADSAGTELSPAIDFKAMNYQGLIPLLIAGYQAQQAQIAQLQTRVEQCCAALPAWPRKMARHRSRAPVPAS